MRQLLKILTLVITFLYVTGGAAYAGTFAGEQPGRYINTAVHVDHSARHIIASESDFYLLAEIEVEEKEKDDDKSYLLIAYLFAGNYIKTASPKSSFSFYNSASPILEEDTHVFLLNCSFRL